MTNTCSDNISLFVMLSKMFINPHSVPARAMFSGRITYNEATMQLLEATVKHRERLLPYGNDYDLFCKELARLGDFSMPHTIDGISADWVLPYEMLHNGEAKLAFLCGILSVLPKGTKIELPLTPEALEELRSRVQLTELQDSQ